MAASAVALGIIFLSQTVFGTLGNSFLLLHYLVLFFTGFRVRHKDLILRNLIVANLLTVLCKGVPQTVAPFSSDFSLGDFGCKLLFYLHRVGRGVSIVTMCLLSVFQVITISPRDSRWTGFKVKAPRYIGFSVYLSWIFYMLINVIILMFTIGNRRNKTITNLKDYGYCSSVRHDKTTDSLFAALLTFPDALCMGLMLWASSSMVLILHRHKQRMQHIQKTSSLRSSPESRATKTILLLVSTFVSFYTLSCIFQIYVGVMSNPNLFMVNMATISAGCFPAVSPFLLMSQGYSAFRFSLVWVLKSNIPDTLTNI